MDILMRLLAYVRGIVTRRQIGLESDDELRFHIEQETSANVARGLSPMEARRRALRDLGGLTRTQEGVRDVRALWVDSAERDLKYAVRTLARAPGFTIVCLLVLALGIGANAAIFSIVDALLLRPLPFPDPDRLVRIDDVVTRLPLRMRETGLELAYPVTVSELGQSQAFSSIGSYSMSGLNFGSERPERLRAAAVTPGLLAALDLQPALGRAFTDGDVKQMQRIAIVSHQLWQRRFGADPRIVGRSVALNGREFIVTGVMPPHMDFPEAADVWIPSSADSQIALQLAVPIFIARLARGVTPVDARAEVIRLTQGGALTKQEAGASTVTVTPLPQALVRDVRPVLLLIVGAALLVLIVACMNAANLLMVRLSARQREFAVRRALGASGLRLARQVLLESLLLAIVAGTAAIAIARWTLDALRAFVPPVLHGAQEIALNGRAFGSLACLSLLTLVLFGVAPAMCVQGFTASVLRGSATADRSWRRFRSILVVSEIAVAVALLVGAASIVRSLGELMTVDLGARDGKALVMEVTLPKSAYASSDRIREFYGRLRDELRGLPGIEEIGATSHLPGSTRVNTASVTMTMEGLTLPSGQLDTNALRLSATPGYFAALGIDVLAGRAFTNVDRVDAQPVALVSEHFARAFGLQPADIIGRRINVAFGEQRWAEVIGVVRDVRMRGPESDVQPAIYVPFAQAPINATGYVVAKAGPRPEQLVPAIRMAVSRIDSALPLYNICTFDEVRAEYLARRRFAMTTMVAFGGLALGLAGVGLYGVISYLVRVRTREIGIRMALGASPAVVGRQVFASGALHAIGGIVIGVTSALGSWKLVSAYVPGVGQVDGTSLAVLSTAVFVVSIGACWFPARRAARVDPLVALRCE